MASTACFYEWLFFVVFFARARSFWTFPLTLNNNINQNSLTDQESLFAFESREHDPGHVLLFIFKI